MIEQQQLRVPVKAALDGLTPFQMAQRQFDEAIQYLSHVPADYL